MLAFCALVALATVVDLPFVIAQDRWLLALFRLTSGVCFVVAAVVCGAELRHRKRGRSIEWSAGVV